MEHAEITSGQDTSRMTGTIGRGRENAQPAQQNVGPVANDTFEQLAGSRFVKNVRANPIPAVMVGVGMVGLAWLAFGRRPRASRYQRTRTEVFDHGKSVGYYEYEHDEPSRLAEAGRSAREMARNAANRVQEAAASAARQVQQAASEAVGALSRDRQH